MADSCDEAEVMADERVEADVGDEALCAFELENETLDTELSIESPSRGRDWRSEIGTAGVLGGCS